MTSQEKGEDQESIKTIGEVQMVGRPRGEIITSRKDIPNIVEEPLVAAVETLFDKGITTIDSNANVEGGRHNEAWIHIDFLSLSDQNKQIARELEEEPPPGLEVSIFETVFPDGEEYALLHLIMPITADTPVGEVEAKFREIAEGFKPQQ